jgi:hypothetical protein
MNRRSFLKTLIGAVAAVSVPQILLPAVESVPVINVPLTTVPVKMPIHKLKCRWTLESARNLRAIHGFEDEVFIKKLQEEIIKTLN